MRNIPRLVPQLQRLKNCATRSRPFTYLDGFLLGASTHSWRNQGRMFRPHNRIFLRGQALRTEKRKKKKETEKRKRKNAPGTLWMLAISRKETKIKQACRISRSSHGPEKFHARLLLSAIPLSVYFLLYFLFHLHSPSFLVSRRALTRLWVNVNFLIEWHDLWSFNIIYLFFFLCSAQVDYHWYTLCINL